MKKSKLFLSVAFALAIAAAVLTNVRAGGQPAWFLDATNNNLCTPSQSDRQGCSAVGTVQCISIIPGEGELYQDGSCNTPLFFE